MSSEKHCFKEAAYQSWKCHLFVYIAELFQLHEKIGKACKFESFDGQEKDNNISTHFKRI